MMSRNAPQAEDGQTLVEYALILVFIAVLLIAAITVFREQLVAVYSRVVAALPG